MTTTTWRGITTDTETALYLTAVAKEVTNLAQQAGVPDFYVNPIPGCGSYQTSTAASAGTHAGGGAVDIDCEPLTDAQARVLESAARKCGGTAWFRPRTSPTGYVYGWQRHTHILRSDCTDLSSAARAQVSDYERGLDGLADNGPDTGNRSWVNQTWAAYKALTQAVVNIAATVVTAASAPVVPGTPFKEDVMKLITAPGRPWAILASSGKLTLIPGGVPVSNYVALGLPASPTVVSVALFDALKGA